MDENNKIYSIIVPIIKALLISLTIIGVLTFCSDCSYKNAGKFPIVNIEESSRYTNYTYGVFLSVVDHSHDPFYYIEGGKQDVKLYLDTRNIIADVLICIVVLSICILKYLNLVNLVNAENIEDTNTNDIENTDISAEDIDAKVTTKTYSREFIVGIKSFMISSAAVLIGTLYSFTPGSLLCIIPLPIPGSTVAIGKEYVYLFVTRYIGESVGIVPRPIKTFSYVGVANIIIDIFIVVLSVVISIIRYKKNAKIANIQETE